MIMPGVQKPHWEPNSSLKRDWIGWRLDSLADPNPSTVVIWHPSTEQSNVKQPFTVRCSTWPDFWSIHHERRTVHAPHPPSPQPSFDPVRFNSTYDKNYILFYYHLSLTISQIPKKSPMRLSITLNDFFSVDIKIKMVYHHLIMNVVFFFKPYSYISISYAHHFTDKIKADAKR